MTREVKNGKVAFKGGQCGRMDQMSGKLFQALITRLEKKYLQILHITRGGAKLVYSAVSLV